MAYRIALLPGDGIGPEVMAQARLVIDHAAAALGLELAYDVIPCGGQYYLANEGRDWPEDGAERCASADLILLGAVGWPRADGKGPVRFPDGRMAGHSAVLGNRSQLDLYANVRPIKLLPGVRHRVNGKHALIWEPGQVDLVIVREGTEGLYAGMGGRLVPGGTTSVAIDTRIITRRACERVIRYAFELCRRRKKGAPKDGRLRVTAISKENVLAGCQLFCEVFREVGAAYPEVEQDFALVDSFTQWLVTEPERYDVCVTTNMFGDIVTDLGAVLQGGMGVAVGCNIGDAHAMFEPIHGSAPQHPKNKANPMAMILAAAAGLRWLGERKADAQLERAASAIEAGVAAVLEAGAPLTYDLVGEAAGAPMTVVGDAIRREVRQRL